MTGEQQDIPHVTPIDSKSSIFEKVHPVLRRRIDQALVDRQPATYRGVYDKFNLKAEGVSYTAFYCYASRVRANAAFIGLAQITLPEGAAVNEMLPELVGHRLFEAALDEETTPQALYRLAQAYRIANEAYYAKRRFAARFEDEQRNAKLKENGQFIKAAEQLLAAQANETFMKGRVAEEIAAAIRARAGSEGQPAPSAPVAARAPARPPHAPSPPSGAESPARVGPNPPPRPRPPRDGASPAEPSTANPKASPKQESRSPLTASALVEAFKHLALTVAAPARRDSRDPSAHIRIQDPSFSLDPSSFSPAPAAIAEPPTPRSHSPTTLTERRQERRRERHRRARR